MKKNLFMVAAVALMALVSCNKEEINNGGVEVTPEPSAVVEFEAGFDVETKTALDAENKKTLWVKTDAISINDQKFVIKEILEDGKAIFVNEAALPSDFAAPFTAIYPYGSNGVPATQTAYANNFDPAAVIEKATSNDYTLNFKNETSLLKFQVPAACKSVSISATESLAEGANTVTISGDMVAETDYYVAVLPGDKTNFVVRIDGYLSKNAASVKINPSTIANMKTLPAAEASTWGIVGAANEWSTDSPLTMYKDLNDCVLIRNFSGGAFKFVKNNTWDISRGIRSRDASSPAKGKWNLCGTKDISLSNGAYDVYFNPKDGVFNYVDKGNNVDTYTTSGKAIYLQVKEWSAADAYFEAWVWGSSQADAWYKFAMAGEKDNNHYVIYVPNDATGMKILRKNPTTASGNWTSWNDSGDQSIPSGKNMFIENGWGAYSWGSYSE